EEFKRGQRYANWRTNEDATEPGQGGTLLSSTPYYHEQHGEGLFTHSLFRLGNRLPDWVNRLVPPSVLVVDEKSWINYPYFRTIITIPFFSKLRMEIETIHLQDDGSHPNALGLSPAELALRRVDWMDIGSEPVAKRDYKAELDPLLVRSKLTGRGPLTPGWQKRERPLMCAYKVVRAQAEYWGVQNSAERLLINSLRQAEYWGVQNSAERLLINSLRQIFLRAHKNCFGLVDYWYAPLSPVPPFPHQIFLLAHKNCFGLLDHWYPLSLEQVRPSPLPHALSFPHSCFLTLSAHTLSLPHTLASSPHPVCPSLFLTLSAPLSSSPCLPLSLHASGRPRKNSSERRCFQVNSRESSNPYLCLPPRPFPPFSFIQTWVIRSPSAWSSPPPLCPLCCARTHHQGGQLEGRERSAEAGRAVQECAPAVFCVSCGEFFCHRCFHEFHITPRLQQHATHPIASSQTIPPAAPADAQNGYSPLNQTCHVAAQTLSPRPLPPPVTALHPAAPAQPQVIPRRTTQLVSAALVLLLVLPLLLPLVLLLLLPLLLLLLRRTERRRQKAEAKGLREQAREGEREEREGMMLAAREVESGGEEGREGEEGGGEGEERGGEEETRSGGGRAAYWGEMGVAGGVGVWGRGRRGKRVCRRRGEGEQGCGGEEGLRGGMGGEQVGGGSQRKCTGGEPHLGRAGWHAGGVKWEASEGAAKGGVRGATCRALNGSRWCRPSLARHSDSALAHIEPSHPSLHLSPSLAFFQHILSAAAAAQQQQQQPGTPFERSRAFSWMGPRVFSRSASSPTLSHTHSHTTAAPHSSAASLTSTLSAAATNSPWSSVASLPGSIASSAAAVAGVAPDLPEDDVCAGDSAPGVADVTVTYGENVTVTNGENVTVTAVQVVLDYLASEAGTAHRHELQRFRAHPSTSLNPSPPTPCLRILSELLADMQPQQLGHSERLAFWINVYNALAMHAYLVPHVSLLLAKLVPPTPNLPVNIPHNLFLPSCHQPFLFLVFLIPLLSPSSHHLHPPSSISPSPTPPQQRPPVPTHAVGLDHCLRSHHCPCPLAPSPPPPPFKIPHKKLTHARKYPTTTLLFPLFQAGLLPVQRYRRGECVALQPGSAPSSHLLPFPHPSTLSTFSSQAGLLPVQRYRRGECVALQPGSAPSSHLLPFPTVHPLNILLTGGSAASAALQAGDVRYSLALDRPEPLVTFALSCGCASAPPVSLASLWPSSLSPPLSNSLPPLPFLHVLFCPGIYTFAHYLHCAIIPSP
ncbi:unnamed protein product, partial [Closterium sp. NIES-65]